jgi:hypothetical protein
MSIVKDLSEYESLDTKMYCPLDSIQPMYFLLADADETNPDLYAEGGILACLVDGIETDWNVNVLPDLVGLVEVVHSNSWSEVGVFKLSILYTIGMAMKTYGVATITVGDNK